MRATETAWLACHECGPMLAALPDSVSKRKLRLFAIACAESVQHLIQSEVGLRSGPPALRFAEQLIDHTSMPAEFEHIFESAAYARFEATDNSRPELSEEATSAALDAICCALQLDAARAAQSAASAIAYHSLSVRNPSATWAEVQKQLGDVSRWHFATTFRDEIGAFFRQADRDLATILRDLFGPTPFHHIAIAGWRTRNTVGIAESIYSDRAFDRMPILADALEDAGCTNADVLEHCRQPGIHVRGCWVVDIVLGKE